jgi:molybdate/tungstate transport system substrate-binding protein
VVGVADFRVIPKFLFGEQEKTGYTDGCAGFATNAITFDYASMNKYASGITSKNSYKILSRPGLQIGRSNPDTVPFRLPDRADAGGGR